MTIWKYGLDITDEQAIKMPSEHEILTVQMQGNTPTVWAIVNPETPLISRVFSIIGTGHNFSNKPGEFVGTVQDGYGLVWHVFVREKGE